jgi:uncharacterized protein involved in outer membrane biogenesis
MIEGDLNAGLIDLTEVLPPLLRHGGRLFSTEPLFMETRPPGDARLGLRATEVRTHKATVANLSADVMLTERQLQLHLLNASVAGGEVEGIITVAPAPQAPHVDIDLHARGILPAQLPQFRGKQISGAPTDLDINVAGTGRSIAAVMGSGNGRILVRVGPGRMPNNLASADLLFETVRLLNPLSTHDPHTAIECVVLNFGVHDGIASTRNGVAVRTDKLTVLGGGVVNLKNERLDIGVQPKPREGTGLNVAALGGDLVRIGGTLSKPVPVADAETVAVAGVKLGAAVATGGLSLLAEGLYDRATAEEDVCAIALRGAPRSAAKGTTTAESGRTSTPAAHSSALDKASETTKKAVKSTGEAVQGAFRKLFGR